MSEVDQPRSKAKQAFDLLLSRLGEIGDRFAGPEWGLTERDDQAEALGAVMAHLATAFETQFVNDVSNPVFRPLVTPWRKSLGDNPDARYYDAPVDPNGVYRITGNTAGAVYISFTIEAGAEGGAFPAGTVGVLNDSEFNIDAAGNFEIVLGGADRDRNWMDLPGSASRITVRIYWEEPLPATLPPQRDLRLGISLIDGDVKPRPYGESSSLDDDIAGSISTLEKYVLDRTIDQIAKPGEGEVPAFVSRVPHEFPPPVVPGDHALAAADAAYSMAPYLLDDDQALVISAQWPQCRFGNVVLWNRQMQTFDYLNHRVSLNRAQATVNEDGTFEVVVSATDPGHPNWLSTTGRQFGIVFWRFMLPEGPITTPQAKVVPVTEVQ